MKPRTALCPCGAVHRRTGRGVATLASVLALLLAAALVVAHAGGALVVEQRSAASQARASSAFEAAEAGLEWGLALLNHPGRVDARCRPSDAAGATTLREHLLVRNAATGRVGPTGGLAACVRDAQGAWDCTCSSTGSPTPAPPAGPDDGTDRPAFALRVDAEGSTGALRLVSTGCSHAAQPCVAQAAGAADARAEVQAQVGWFAALAHPPTAALTARGAVVLVDNFGVHNTHARAGGLTVHAGGSVSVTSSALRSTPGTPPAAALAGDDPALRNVHGDLIDGDTFFARVFGLTKSRMRALPGLHRLDCAGGCSAAQLRHALSGSDTAMLWVDGALALDDGGSIGTRRTPVLIVVDGPVRLDGSTQLHGVLYSTAALWAGGSGAVTLHGAAVAEGEFVGTGATQIHHDAGVLQRLAERAGAYVRLPGGWQDFGTATP